MKRGPKPEPQWLLVSLNCKPPNRLYPSSPSPLTAGSFLFQISPPDASADKFQPVSRTINPSAWNMATPRRDAVTGIRERFLQLYYLMYIFNIREHTIFVTCDGLF